MDFHHVPVANGGRKISAMGDELISKAGLPFAAVPSSVGCFRMTDVWVFGGMHASPKSPEVVVQTTVSGIREPETSLAAPADRRVAAFGDHRHARDRLTGMFSCLQDRCELAVLCCLELIPSGQYSIKLDARRTWFPLRALVGEDGQLEGVVVQTW